MGEWLSNIVKSCHFLYCSCTPIPTLAGYQASTLNDFPIFSLSPYCIYLYIIYIYIYIYILYIYIDIYCYIVSICICGFFRSGLLTHRLFITFFIGWPWSCRASGWIRRREIGFFAFLGGMRPRDILGGLTNKYTGVSDWIMIMDNSQAMIWFLWLMMMINWLIWL